MDKKSFLQAGHTPTLLAAFLYFDLAFMESLISDPKWATQYSIKELVEKTGTQGVELVMWLAARGALGERVKEVTRNYHIPISNTAAAVMLYETADAAGAGQGRKAAAFA